MHQWPAHDQFAVPWHPAQRQHAFQLSHGPPRDERQRTGGADHLAARRRLGRPRVRAPVLALLFATMLAPVIIYCTHLFLMLVEGT